MKNSELKTLKINKTPNLIEPAIKHGHEGILTASDIVEIPNESRRAMTRTEFEDLILYIHDNHRFGRNGMNIKYVTPTIDMRTGDIHSVTFYYFTDEITLSITNENRNRDLTQWVYKWLSEAEE